VCIGIGISSPKRNPMLNRTPPKASSTLNSFRKRRRLQGPILMYGAIGLVVLGFVLLVVWLTRPGQPLGQYFATDTPTATLTTTPTNTLTPSITPTITETPTATVTFTPSGPQQYVVQEGDSLLSIADRFNLGSDGDLLIYYANLDLMERNQGFIKVGDSLLIPAPGSVFQPPLRFPPIWDVVQRLNTGFCRATRWQELLSGSTAWLTKSSRKIPTLQMPTLSRPGKSFKSRSTL